MFDFYTLTLAAGQTKPLAVTARAFLCSDLSGSISIGFDGGSPAPALKGLLLNFPAEFRRLLLANPGATEATIAFYTSLAWLGLGPLGSSGSGGGPAPDPVHVINPVGGSLHVTQDNVPSGLASAANQTSGDQKTQVTNFPATQPVSAAALPLPDGAATAANQTSGDQKTQVTNFPATQPVSAAALPLPDGAATAANQTSGDQKTQVTNFPATQPVSAAALPLPSGAATAANQTSGDQKTQVTNFPSSQAITMADPMNVQNAPTTTLQVQVTSAKRGVALALCAAYTPTATGPDSFECPAPYDPKDGTTSITWKITRLSLRVAVAGGAPAITLEKSTATGAFSATSLGSLTLGAGTYEGAVTTALGTANSGDKLRFNISTLGTAQGWNITVELGEQ